MVERPMPMEEVPPVLPPDPWSETAAMMLVAVHPHGHEGPLEVSRTDTESTVTNGSCVEEDTREDLPTEEVAEGIHRELDLMKSFLVYQAVPRAEVTDHVWSTRCFYRSESAFCGETICKLPGRNCPQSHFWARGHESFVGHGSVEGPHRFVL